MKPPLGIALAVMLCGCKSVEPPPYERPFPVLSRTEAIKHQLIGHTTGGREKSWKFRSLDQFEYFEITKREIIGREEVYEAEAIMRALETGKRVKMKLRIRRAWGVVETVGLLYIEQL